MRKRTKLKLLERDIRCLKIMKTVSKTASLVRLTAGVVLCAVVAFDVLRIFKR